MPKEVHSFGDAADQSMIIRVECGCGRIEYFVAKDVARVWGKRRAIAAHKFRCKKCTAPTVTVTPVDIDLDRMPRGFVMRLRAGGHYGDPEWRRERFRG
jgi:hypothetical protein